MGLCRPGIWPACSTGLRFNDGGLRLLDPTSYQDLIWEEAEETSSSSSGREEIDDEKTLPVSRPRIVDFGGQLWRTAGRRYGYSYALSAAAHQRLPRTGNGHIVTESRNIFNFGYA